MRLYLRYLVALLIGMMFSGFSGAGPVSASAAQLSSIADLIRGDAQAKAQFAKLKRIADRALDAAPDPVQRIVSAGTLKSDPDKIETTESLKDMPDMEAMAWVWAITGERRYLEQTKRYILAWSSVNISDGHPINETKFEPLIVAYDLVRNEFPVVERQKVDGWLRDKAERDWASPSNRDQNYQSHRIKIVTLVGLALDDARLISIALEGFKDQIGVNLKSDGRSVDFERRDALHYHLYDVMPLLTAACAFKQDGVDLFDYRSPNGASLRAAVDFIVPYVHGEKQHIEFANSTVKFDKIRANHGESAFKPKRWKPERALPVFVEAACLDPEYARKAGELAKSNDRFISWQSVLNATYRPAPTHR